MTTRFTAASALAFAFASVPAFARASVPAPVSAPAWQYTVSATRLAADGRLAISLSLTGAQDAEGLCLGMARAAPFVRDLQLASDPPTPLLADPEDPDCFLLPAPHPEPLRARYSIDLRALAAHTGDPDWASRTRGGDYVFQDGATLLRPAPVQASEGVAVTVDLELPAGLSVAAPWDELPAPPGHQRFRTDARQLDSGGYLALGKLKQLEDFEVGGGRFRISVASGPTRASPRVLRGWVGLAGRTVADFYGGLPGGLVHVVLLPVPGAGGDGVFGTVLRSPRPSVVMMFGAGSAPADFAGGWMPFHELFHLGNPRVEGKLRWFLEGVATYYQDVLRARAGVQSREAMWGDVWDGLRRFCDPERGRTLRAESRELPKSHRWMQVYWSGACLLFRADVAIRARTGNAQSLDTVLRDLRLRGEAERLTEDELVAALDAAAGEPLARGHLDATGPVAGAPAPVAMKALLVKLGVQPTGPETVKLVPGPWSQVRDAIFAPDGKAAPATSAPRSSGSRR